MKIGELLNTHKKGKGKKSEPLELVYCITVITYSHGNAMTPWYSITITKRLSNLSLAASHLHGSIYSYN